MGRYQAQQDMYEGGQRGTGVSIGRYGKTRSVIKTDIVKRSPEQTGDNNSLWHKNEKEE